MKQEMIIVVSITIAASLVIGIKIWLHSLLKFKMDESAILRFLEESSDDYRFRSTEAISTGTEIDAIRVSKVCAQSKAIKRNAKEIESWCIKVLKKL
jgi:hypothetical protein